MFHGTSMAKTYGSPPSKQISHLKLCFSPNHLSHPADSYDALRTSLKGPRPLQDDQTTAGTALVHPSSAASTHESTGRKRNIPAHGQCNCRHNRCTDFILFDHRYFRRKGLICLRQWFTLVRQPSLVAPKKSDLSANDQILAVSPHFT